MPRALDNSVAIARLALIDNRGIGDSDVPGGPYDTAVMAGDVIATDGALDPAVRSALTDRVQAERPDVVARVIELRLPCDHHRWSSVSALAIVPRNVLQFEIWEHLRFAWTLS